MLMVVSLRNQTIITNHQVRGGYTRFYPWTSWPPVISMNSNALGPAWNTIRFEKHKNHSCWHIWTGQVVPLPEIWPCHPNATWSRNPTSTSWRQSLQTAGFVHPRAWGNSDHSWYNWWYILLFIYDDMSSKKQEVEMFGPSENLILQWQVACEWTTHVSDSICLRTLEQM